MSRDIIDSSNHPWCLERLHISGCLDEFGTATSSTELIRKLELLVKDLNRVNIEVIEKRV